MLRLRIIRPNTVGTTFEKEFEDYTDAEEFIERKCEYLADHGWNLDELSKSTALAGTIEATHDEIADSLLIKWNTIEEQVNEFEESEAFEESQEEI